MSCNIDKLMTSLFRFLHYTIDHFPNTCDYNNNNTFYLILYNHFHVRTGDESPSSSVDHSQKNIRAKMYYDFCLEKSFQKRFQSLKHYVEDRCFQVVQTVHVWRENVGRR